MRVCVCWCTSCVSCTQQITLYITRMNTREMCVRFFTRVFGKLMPNHSTTTTILTVVVRDSRKLYLWRSFGQMVLYGRSLSQEFTKLETVVLARDALFANTKYDRSGNAKKMSNHIQFYQLSTVKPPRETIIIRISYRGRDTQTRNNRHANSIV